jgi:hypothetical protein
VFVLFCSQCGSEVPPKAGFCSSCGTKVEVKVEIEQPNGSEQEVAVTTTTTVSPHQSVELASDLQPVIPTDQRSTIPQKFIRNRVAIGASFGIVILLVVAAFFLLQHKKEEPLLFFGENELLMQSSDQKEPITLSDNVYEEGDGYWDGDTSNSQYRYMIQNFVKMNEDQNKLFFIDRIREDGSGSIYYRDLKKKLSSWDGEAGIKLASGVDEVNGMYTINNKGNSILYIKGYDSDNGGKLYYHDLTEETVIDSQVTNYWFSDEHSLVYYLKTDDNGDEDLYWVEMDKLDDKTKVDSNVYNIEQFEEETGNVYYTKINEDESINELTLYKKSLKEDKVKLLSGIDSIDSDIVDDEFYYTVAEEKEVSLASLVDDDLAENDAAILEPVYSDFETIVQSPQTDWWTGETYYVEQTETNYDAYNLAYEAYNMKQSRDQLRQSLKERVMNDVSYALHLFSEGKETKITDNFVNYTYRDVASKTILYSKNDRSTMGKILLSTIEYVEDVENAFNEQVTQSPITYMASGSVLDTEFTDEGTSVGSVVLSDDGKLLYCIETTESSSELVSYEMTEGKPTKRKELDDGVDSFSYIPGESQLYYYKEVEDGSGELYVLSDDKGKRIAIDVKIGSASFYPEDGTLLYMTDYNEKEGTGTLLSYKKEESTRIANDIGAYFYTQSSKLYYLENFNVERGYGDLVEYLEKGKVNPISDRVYMMYPTQYWYFF